MSFPILKVQFIRTLVKFEALSKLIGCYNFFHIICIYTFFTAVVQRLKSQIFLLYIDYYHPSSFLSRIKRDVNFFLNAFNHIFTPYVLYTGRNNFVRLAGAFEPRMRAQRDFESIRNGRATRSLSSRAMQSINRAFESTLRERINVESP